MSERQRKPEPGKSSLTSSSHCDHDAHGPGKRTLTEALPYRAPARPVRDRNADRGEQANDDTQDGAKDEIA